MMRQHVRALKVYVSVDEAWRQKLAFQFMDCCSIAACAGRMNAGNHRAYDTYVSVPKLACDDINDLTITQQQIERRSALRGVHRSASCLSVNLRLPGIRGHLSLRLSYAAAVS